MSFTTRLMSIMAPAAALLLPAVLPAQTVRICPAGNSLTQASPGYRGPLLAALKSAGFNVDFVGPLTDGVGSGFAGYGGFTIGPGLNKALDQYNGGPGTGNLYAKKDLIMATNPDIILLEIGINDYYNEGESGYNVATESPPKLANLIEAFFTAKPAMAIFVQSIGWTWGDGREINDAIPGIVAAQAAKGRKCYFVDMRNECTITRGETGDGLHPVASAYYKMSDVWFAHLKPYLSNQAVADTLPAITGDPRDASVLEGQTVTMYVSATGKTPLQYQWTRNGTPMPGKTDDTLAFSAVTADSGALYRCIVSNTLGRDTSAAARLTVTSSAGLSIGRMAAPPTIDGAAIPSWQLQRSFPLARTIIGTASSALAATWRAGWDNANLYLVVQVTDPTVVGTHDQANGSQDDGVELYIDGGNEKAATYDANDRFYRFSMNQTSVFALSGEPVTGIAFRLAPVTGGYVVEASIPWTTIGTTAAVGKVLGFDVHVNDNNSGIRDRKITWWSTQDNAWNNTSGLGTVLLVSQATGASTARFFHADRGIGVSRLRDRLHVTIAGSCGSTAISLVDMLGHRVRQVRSSGGVAEMGLTGIPAGMYVVKTRGIAVPVNLSR